MLDPHVLAAAFEGPIDERDAETLGEAAVARAAELPELERTPAGYVWKGRDYPAARISLRSGEPDSFTLVDAETGSVLGLVERSRAYSTVHEGAVYLHLGEQYLVQTLDHVARAAVVAPGDRATGTRRRRRRPRRRSRRRSGSSAGSGSTSTSAGSPSPSRSSPTSGVRSPTATCSRRVPLDLPETTFETEAIWFCPEPSQLAGLEEMPTLLSSLHAAEHSLIALLPLWAMCDRWDIGGLSTNVHFQTGRPTVFVYDGHAGGVGITERGFERLRGAGSKTRRACSTGCPCASGCPSCVQSPKCGNLNDMLDKAGALTLLARLLDG